MRFASASDGTLLALDIAECSAVVVVKAIYCIAQDPPHHPPPRAQHPAAGYLSSPDSLFLHARRRGGERRGLLLYLSSSARTTAPTTAARQRLVPFDRAEGAIHPTTIAVLCRELIDNGRGGGGEESHSHLLGLIMVLLWERRSERMDNDTGGCRVR